MPTSVSSAKVPARAAISGSSSRARTAGHAESRRYLPDFIVVVNDGRGDDDLLRLAVEIKGYRQEAAKEKKSTMDTYWVPGVNTLGTYGRWAFAELTDVWEFEKSFNAAIDAAAGATA